MKIKTNAPVGGGERSKDCTCEGRWQWEPSDIHSHRRCWGWVGGASKGKRVLFATLNSSSQRGVQVRFGSDSLRPLRWALGPSVVIFLPLHSSASGRLLSLLTDRVAISLKPADHFLRGMGGWPPGWGFNCCCCCCLLTWARISWIFLWASWTTKKKKG